MALSGDVLCTRTSDESASEKENVLASGRGALCTGSDTDIVGKDHLAVLNHGTTELGENEGCAMNVVVVVLASGDLAERGRDRPGGVERTANKADLTGGVCAARRNDEHLKKGWMSRYAQWPSDSQVGMVVNAYSATGNKVLVVSLNSLIIGK